MMKFVLTILLLVLLVVIQTPLGQLLKIPVFLEHFDKHREVKEVSLIEFLEEHYSSGHNDEDQSEDAGLPFKTGMPHEIGNVIINSFFEIKFALNNIVPITILFQEHNIPQQHLCSIFHPPRTF